ncbi:MAG: hypothetical protein AABZ14_04855 [Candidatus Margulisiibacteriota bacterium]
MSEVGQIERKTQNRIVKLFQNELKYNYLLSVYPPLGKVKISAPNCMDLNAIRIYAISKLGWIKKQRLKLQSQEREAPREYLHNERFKAYMNKFLPGWQYLKEKLNQSPLLCEEWRY